MLWPRWREMWLRFLVNEEFIARPELDPEEPLGWSRGSGSFYVHAVRADGRVVQNACSNSSTYEKAVEQAERRAANPSAGTIAYIVADRSTVRLYRADVVRSHGET